MGCNGSRVITCYDVYDPELPWRQAVLGRYTCLTKATAAGKGAGERGADLTPREVQCVVLQGQAFPVSLRGERSARYHEFSGRFCAEEWEDWERGSIEPSIMSGGLAWAVDVMQGKPLDTSCTCSK